MVALKRSFVSSTGEDSALHVHYSVLPEDRALSQWKDGLEKAVHL